MILDVWVAELEAYRKLKENWDSYGAHVPSSIAINTIKPFLSKYTNCIYAMTPVPDGGVWIEWGNHERFIQLWVTRNGDKHILTKGITSLGLSEQHDVSDQMVLTHLIAMQMMDDNERTIDMSVMMGDR